MQFPGVEEEDEKKVRFSAATCALVQWTLVYSTVQFRYRKWHGDMATAIPVVNSAEFLFQTKRYFFPLSFILDLDIVFILDVESYGS